MSDEQNIQNQEEVITVEPGQEGLTVEEEMAAATPAEEEAPAEEVKAEEEATPSSEETPEESRDVSGPVEGNATEASDVDEPEKSEEATTEKKKEEEESAVEEQETKEEEENKEEVQEEQDEKAEADKRIAEMEAELEKFREAEEIRQLTATREQAISNASKQLDDFNDKLARAMEDTLKQYGIDTNMSMEELEKDPAKFQIAKDIVANAQALQRQKQAELMQPITEASNAIIFREAGKEMAKFGLTEDQTQVAAKTLIEIFDATGLANLTDDLKAKVELAVAKAKMLVPRVEKVAEEVKDIAKDTAQAVTDVIAAESKKEDVQKALEEKVEEQKVSEPVEEKPSLDAFKEGATADAPASAPVETVTEDNALEILAKLPTKERTRFLQEHYAAVEKAYNKRRNG